MDPMSLPQWSQNLAVISVVPEFTLMQVVCDRRQWILVGRLFMTWGVSHQQHHSLDPEWVPHVLTYHGGCPLVNGLRGGGARLPSWIWSQSINWPITFNWLQQLWLLGLPRTLSTASRVRACVIRAEKQDEPCAQLPTSTHCANS